MLGRHLTRWSLSSYRLLVRRSREKRCYRGCGKQPVARLAVTRRAWWRWPRLPTDDMLWCSQRDAPSENVTMLPLGHRVTGYDACRGRILVPPPPTFARCRQGSGLCRQNLLVNDRRHEEASWQSGFEYVKSQTRRATGCCGSSAAARARWGPGGE